MMTARSENAQRTCSRGHWYQGSAPCPRCYPGYYARRRNRENSLKINSYIATLLPWQKEIVVALRDIVHRADPDILEDWKWNKPAFSHDGLICWIWAFKKWVSFTLYQGSLVPDVHGLYNHGTYMDRNRTIAFTSASEIREEPLIEYIRQAVANSVAGRKVKVVRKRGGAADLPGWVQRRLDPDLQAAFAARPPYQKRDYISWISGAKLVETRERRLSQMLDDLRRGDRYMGMPWRGRGR